MVSWPMNIATASAKRISQLIEKNNLTQYRLAKEILISQNAMSSIVNGKNKSINTSTVFLICKALNISVAEFYDDPVFDLSNIVIE